MSILNNPAKRAERRQWEIEYREFTPCAVKDLTP